MRHFKTCGDLQRKGLQKAIVEAIAVRDQAF
jgi:hypothetical protein